MECVDSCSFHSTLRLSHLGDWFILPVQYVSGNHHTSICERAWWFKYRCYALNDVPPAIEHDDSQQQNTATAQSRLSSFLKQIAIEKRACNYAKVSSLRAEFARVAQELAIPTISPKRIAVPNMTNTQKIRIDSIVRQIVKRTKKPVWERQALTHLVTLTRTVPCTLRSVVERLTHSSALDTHAPVCHCSSQNLPIWQAAGRVSSVGIHHALIPVQLSFNGQFLRPKDPLPITGEKARGKVRHGLRQLARTFSVACPNLTRALPIKYFPQKGEALDHVLSIFTPLTDLAYTRIVDKGAGIMWIFCRHWVWDIAVEFLLTHGYIPTTLTSFTV